MNISEEQIDFPRASNDTEWLQAMLLSVAAVCGIIGFIVQSKLQREEVPDFCQLMLPNISFLFKYHYAIFPRTEHQYPCIFIVSIDRIFESHS